MNLKDINLQSYSVIRRDGSVVAFEPEKIRIAVAKAFLFDHHGKEWVDGKRELSDSEHILVAQVLQDVVAAVTKRKPGGGSIHIEDIQDQVELHLMRTDQHKVARSFMLYREADCRSAQQPVMSTKMQGSRYMTEVSSRGKPLRTKSRRFAVIYSMWSLAKLWARLSAMSTTALVSPNWARR